MMNVLIYTTPARGHLYPIMGTALELRRRGHRVALRTLASDVERVRATGLACEPIAAAIEEREMDDYTASSPIGAIRNGLQTWLDRAPLEIEDLRRAVDAVRPDVLVVDANAWGAQAAAEASGLPWVGFLPYLHAGRSEAVPPFGLGLAPRADWIGRVRDRVVRRLTLGPLNQLLPELNALRAELGVPPIPSMDRFLDQAPRLLYFTAEPFDYPRPDWPANVRAVGPGLWCPPSEPPAWLDGIDRPLVLVTISTEYQDDGALVETALRALADEDVFVVATTAAVDPASFDVPHNARVEHFVPHEHLVPRADVVICHGGMGITQRALASGVPVVVVPFGRDQNETARRVLVAGCGDSLKPGKLSESRLRTAVQRARERRAGAQRIAESFAAAGGAARAADVVQAAAEEPLARSA